MSKRRRSGTQEIHVFPVDEFYLFKHYFDDEAVWDRLKRWYNNQQYRFEVPESEFGDVRSFLEDEGYGVTVIESLEKFVVVVKKYTGHPENIFKESVIQRSVDGYNCFLMTDQMAVARAVDEGAVRFGETGLSSPFE